MYCWSGIAIIPIYCSILFVQKHSIVLGDHDQTCGSESHASQSVMAKIDWSSNLQSKCSENSLSITYSKASLFDVDKTSCISWYDTGAIICTRGRSRDDEWLHVSCLIRAAVRWIFQACCHHTDPCGGPPNLAR
ncbi:hypothetical protein Y032_0057g2747 [Ancylostoma ceylanicum]|uniref:Uncharacterized protein n=1 Tax=Ancylostoma ceylanicum TaxID=53326 RepID=A0A016U483_9BILA|nr:hypothetical protein Y032_0057g2747 [Ancylostoma ceylanicum]